jgi:5-methylcytosine-specific restriction protein A
MLDYGFIVGHKYTKADIYKICNVPASKQKGNWNTGYTNYKGDWFIFCNVGVPGRTGHDYQNRFAGDELVWYGKTASHIGQESIQSMIQPRGEIFIFYREEDRNPFTFAGKARATSHKPTVPIEITWSFNASDEQRPEVLPEEITDPTHFIEGATKSIFVNVYERNPQARKTCIAKHGVACAVCGFDFAKIYGEIGEGFIHIHHLKQLADIGVEYELNPIEDLRPVCPNCHAMLHRRRPAYSIEELAAQLKTVNDA